MYIYSPHCLSSERKRYLFSDVLGETLESTWPRGKDVRIHVKNKREIVVDFLIISYNMVSLVLQMDGRDGASSTMSKVIG